MSVNLNPSKFTDLVCFGFNCGATETARYFRIYSGNIPTDWTITSPTCFYNLLKAIKNEDINSLVEKFFTITHGDAEPDEKLIAEAGEKPISRKYPINWFGMEVPHHVQTDTNIENIEGVSEEYKPSFHSKDNIYRRFVRLKNLLTNPYKKILFLYTDCRMQNETSVEEFLPVDEMLSVYRPKESYQIVFIDGGYETKKKQGLLKTNDRIKHLAGVEVDTERFFVHPAVFKLKETYPDLLTVFDSNQ